MGTFAVLVAFKVNQDRSILYKKCTDIENLVRVLRRAWVLDADFISIRFPKKKEK